MRQPLHPAALATIIERRPRQPLPNPGRRGPLPRYGFVVAVVAAHDAEERLPATLESLDAQTRRPDAVVVVADRCTDATVVTALVHGATVVETNDNVHGCTGALDLALTEVLGMVDDDDAILLVGDGVVLAPSFVASGLAALWRTAPPTRRWRSTTRPAGLVVSTPTSPAATPAPAIHTADPRLRNPAVGTAWPGGVAQRTGDATMTLAGALREVVGARATGRLHDPRHPTSRPTSGRRRGSADRTTVRDSTRARASVLDVTAEHPDAELAVALDALGYDTVAPTGCLASRHTHSPLDARHHYRAHRRAQHATLRALGAHGLGGHTRRTVAGQARLALEVTAPLVAVATVAGVVATGGPVVPLTTALAAGGLLWMTERGWAHRHSGRHLPAELARGLTRSVAAAAGVAAGTWRWLAGLRLRHGVWRHPASGRVLARRTAPFPGPATMSLVRVPGAAIAIERSGPASDVIAERWRRRALAGCVMSLIAVALLSLPLLAPVAAAVVVGTWAGATVTVSTARLCGEVWRQRTRG